MSGRAPKQKGNRFEREIVNRLLGVGIKAARLPLSGAMRGIYGGCDVTLSMLGRECRAELKHHRNGFATFYKWIARVHILIVRRDHDEPLVVMPFKTFVELLQQKHEP